ncbi:hypothetical protein FF100_04815 [Methylobacterium terricola]|uniref:Uncharacterized protein n=1 Tax=Methylobacterium terricola TaxID=2583531 RepID=A0A5C4LMU2_9HYPH|nr:hypothetical protein [Methylobacterium terricola]TNC14900.1 hypothetical protein FF100_04815 [Methylobacterium terricola]
MVRQQIAGIPGPMGPASSFRGFGTVDYSDLDAVTLSPSNDVLSGIPLPMVAGQWTRVTRDLQPSDSNRNPLADPFAGFSFWDGALLRAHAVGDIYLYKLTYRVMPTLRGSSLRFAFRPGGNPNFDFGPQPIVLSTDAGSEEIGSETFVTQVRSRFATMGAEVYVWSSSGGQLLEFSPEITPLGHA